MQFIFQYSEFGLWCTLLRNGDCFKDVISKAKAVDPKQSNIYLKEDNLWSLNRKPELLIASA
jgi:hypothetical protein